MMQRQLGRNDYGSCYPKHYISSYKLGKKVVKKIQQVVTLMADGCFEAVADTVPPAPVEA